MPVSNSYSCVSSQSNTTDVGFGSINIPNLYWYPPSLAEYVNANGRTYEFFLYSDGLNPTTTQYIRHTRQASSLQIFAMGYRRSGAATGANTWYINMAGNGFIASYLFNFALIPNEWYHFVARTYAGGEPTAQSVPVQSYSRIAFQIGRTGRRADGADSLGPDMWPYGAGTNGGFLRTFPRSTNGLAWRPLRLFGGYFPSSQDRIRASWGGLAATTGNNPAFSSTWRGGWAEERLWSELRNDGQIAANRGDFAPVDGPLVYLRWNDQITDPHTYDGTGSTSVAGQVGFAQAGSSDLFGQGDVAWINHVDPAINTPGENPTNFPTSPFAPAINSVTILPLPQGAYRVLYTDDPIENDGAYKVVETVPIDRPAIYKVNVPGEITPNPTGDYKVVTDATPIEEDGEYAITYDGTPIENDGAYDILLEAGEITPNPQGEYVVTTDGDEVILQGIYRVTSDATPVEEDGEYRVLIDNEIENVGVYRVLIEGTFIHSGSSDYFVITGVGNIENDGAYAIAGTNFVINRQGAYAIQGVDLPKIERSGRYAVQVDADGLADKALRVLGWERMNRLSGRP